MEPKKTSENKADAAALPEDEQVAAWEQIETGRYMPRRVRGSCHGRELG